MPRISSLAGLAIALAPSLTAARSPPVGAPFCALGAAAHLPSGGPRAYTFVARGRLARGLDRGDLDEALGRAARTWSTVACSTVRIRLGAAEGPWETEVPVAFVSARQSACLSAGGEERIAAAPCPIGDGFGIELDRDAGPWSSSPREGAYDLSAVLTHELGHILGLDHSADPLAAMAPGYRPDGGQRELSADDRARLCARDPLAEPRAVCASDEACRAALGEEGARCVEALGWRVCDKERLELGAYCSVDRDRCAEACAIVSEAGTGFCTRPCAGDEACPEAWICERAGAAGRVCVERGVEPEQGGCVSAPRGEPGPGRFALLIAALGLATSLRSGRRRRARRATRASDRAPSRGRSR